MEQTWYGFRMEEFPFCGRNGIIVFPDEQMKNGRWMLKTEYWGAFPEAEIALVKKGFHLAFLQNSSRFATEKETAEKAEFCRYLSEHYDLQPRATLIGMSCGGAHALTFAGMFPELAESIVLDGPVVNYLSYPGKMGDPEQMAIWENEFVKAYPGIRHRDLLNFGNHPISRIERVIEHQIPVLMLYGTQDTAVLYEENGKLLEEAYQQYPDLLTIIPKPLYGHHPHGLADPGTIVDFVVNARRP